MAVRHAPAADGIPPLKTGRKKTQKKIEKKTKKNLKSVDTKYKP
jgi:hypothetical protein